MTTYDYGTDAPTSAGAGGVKDQAQQVAGTAADEGKHVAGVAKSEAQSVAADAKEQARNLMSDARSQIEEQSRSQLDSLVTMLQGFADDLEKMARGEGAGGGLAQDVVTQVSDKAKAFTSELQGREPSEVLDRARDFARRRPGTFLLGALAAGVVAGRVARGAKDAGGGPATGSTSTPTSTSTSTPTGAGSSPAPEQQSTPTQPGMYSAPPPPASGGTAADTPLSGTGAPAETPVYPEGGSTPGGTL